MSDPSPRPAHRPAARKGAEEPLRLIYVIGSGRSGSTVFDTLLGNHPRVEGLGELTNLVQDGWQRGLYCACGARGTDCEFWGGVREAWSSRLGLAEVGEEELSEYVHLQRRFERYRNLPWVGVAGLLRTPGFRRYAHLTRTLLQAIREVSGKPYLVDSSKTPTRAMALSWIPGIDLRLVQLVRDGRGVAYSLSRSYPKDEKRGLQKAMSGHPVTRSASRWVLANLAASFVRARMPRDKATLLRYEDFLRDTPAALGGLSEVVGIDLYPLAERVENGEAFSPAHTIAGNRVRMSGPIRLRFDEAWREKLEEGDRRAFERRAGWLLRRYGYET